MKRKKIRISDKRYYTAKCYSFGKTWTEFKHNPRGISCCYVYWDSQNSKLLKERQTYIRRKREITKARQQHRKKQRRIYWDHAIR